VQRARPESPILHWGCTDLPRVLREEQCLDANNNVLAEKGTKRLMQNGERGAICQEK
jgi:hypothetical protein